MRSLFAFAFLALPIAAVVAGGLYAPFTASDDDSGTVTAGTVDIRLNTLKAVDEIVWDGTGCQSDQMVPGETCTDNVTVRNDGTAELWYAVMAMTPGTFPGETQKRRLSRRPLSPLTTAVARAQAHP